MSAPLPCPFCGGEQAVTDTFNYANGRPRLYRVRCEECGVTTRWSNTEEQAREWWNTRAATGDRDGRKKKAGRPETRPESPKKKPEKTKAGTTKRKA